MADLFARSNLFSREEAERLDAEDKLNGFRDRFFFPVDRQGQAKVYFCGNSLGLQPREAMASIQQVMQAWQDLAVDGHFTGQLPWMEYHRHLAALMANLVGALPMEVTVMNTLTTNIHLALGSFYRPAGFRTRILMEADAFPSDRYAVESWVRLHGLDPDVEIVRIAPETNGLLSLEQIRAQILEMGDRLALVFLGNVNYYTGQYLPMGEISSWAHEVGALAGFDLAHAVGNIPTQLHDDSVDFATWCTYKYLNGGPGSIAGFFVHERNHHLPRLAGWWGQRVSTRFDMRTPFQPEPGAEGWQVSNQPILSMAPLHTSLAIFAEAGRDSLRQKSEGLTAYLYDTLAGLSYTGAKILTPADPASRGCQLSYFLPENAELIYLELLDAGFVVDFRKPDVIRIAPVPLYNSFLDVWKLGQKMQEIARSLAS